MASLYFTMSYDDSLYVGEEIVISAVKKSGKNVHLKIDVPENITVVVAQECSETLENNNEDLCDGNN